jgi:hypothetical protein
MLCSVGMAFSFYTIQHILGTVGHTENDGTLDSLLFVLKVQVSVDEELIFF